MATSRVVHPMLGSVASRPAFLSLVARPSSCLPNAPRGHAESRSVRLQASRTRRPPPRIELARDVAAGSEVDLVRRLAVEGGMRETAVVFLDVERDEPPERRDGVERVEVEPLVLERSPPGLDHRVRESDLGHRKEASKDTRADVSFTVILDPQAAPSPLWPLLPGGKASLRKA